MVLTVKDFLQRHRSDTLDLETPCGPVRIFPSLTYDLLNGISYSVSNGTRNGWQTFPAEHLLNQEITSVKPDGKKADSYHITTSLECIADTRRLETVDLSNCTLRDIDLSGICFDGATFYGTQFEHVDFAQCMFLDCDFRWAQFTGCNFENAAAVNCDFTSAAFKSGSTSKLQFKKCNMDSVHLSDFNLHCATVDEQTRATSAELSGALLWPIDVQALRPLSQRDVSIMAANHALWTLGAGGAQADFSGCLLQGLDMKGIQLQGAVFDGAVIENCNLSSAELCNASFEGVCFLGTDLTEANAEDANFREASFRNCDLRHAKLIHSNLSHVDLLSSELWHMDIRGSCVEDSNLSEQYNWTIQIDNLSENEADWCMEHSLGIYSMKGLGE